MSISSDPKIAVVGTGAIGGLLGSKFLSAGYSVTLLERGERLAALQRNGLTMLEAQGARIHHAKVSATDDFRAAGPHDLVILAVKAHQVERVAPSLPDLFHEDTMVMTVQNGLPWWYFQGLAGPYEGLRLKTLDPTGAICDTIESRRLIGCVAYPAATVVEPGVVRHVEGDRFPLGELNGLLSSRCRLLESLFTSAGFRSRVLEDIRNEIWLKAWGSLSFNPLSALTRATMVDICRQPETRNLARDMMMESQAVAEKLGVKFRHTIERRLDGAEKVGAHKTSMLQDLESGQKLELEALLGSVIELAHLTETKVPRLEAVYACTKLLDSVVREALRETATLP